MAVYYDSAGIFISSGTSLKDKVAKIDLVISALLDTALKAAINDNIQEYSLNDGQVIIRSTYRGTKDIAKGIKELESVKQMYINSAGLNGRVVRLVDSKSIGKGYGR